MIKFKRPPSACNNIPPDRILYKVARINPLAIGGIVSTYFMLMSIARSHTLTNKSSLDRILFYFHQILLCLTLTYFFFVHMFSFWRFYIFSFRMVYFVEVILISLMGLLVFIRHHKTISIFEYMLLPITMVYTYLAYRLYPEAIWYRAGELHWIFFGIGLGVMFVRDKIQDWVFWIPLLIIAGVISYNYFILNITAETGVFLVNRNIYAMILTALGFLGLVNYAIKNQLNTYPALLMAIVILLLSSYSMSRGSFFISGGIVLLVTTLLIIREFKETIKNWGKRKTRDLISITAILLVTSAIIFLTYVLFAQSRLSSQGFTDQSRIAIYEDFLSFITIKDLIRGFNPSLVVPQYSHLHSSILQAIAETGLYAWVMVSIFFVALIKTIRYRSPIFFFLILLAVYSLVDHVMLLRYCDILLFPLLVYAIQLKNPGKTDSN